LIRNVGMRVNEEERGGDYKPDSKEENVGETFWQTRLWA
jgi:hypothetical protein